jgi:hypothetical protein
LHIGSQRVSSPSPLILQQHATHNHTARRNRRSELRCGRTAWTRISIASSRVRSVFSPMNTTKEIRTMLLKSVTVDGPLSAVEACEVVRTACALVLMPFVWHLLASSPGRLNAAPRIVPKRGHRIAGWVLLCHRGRTMMVRV